MVGWHLAADGAVVEGLRGRQGPVLVVSVRDLVRHRVVVSDVDAALDRGAVAQLPVAADLEGNGLALDALEVVVAVGELSAPVQVTVFALVVSADADELTSLVSSQEPELVLGVGGLVDDLAPELGELLLPDGGDADVEFVAELKVQLGLDGGLAGLVVLNSALIKER